MIEYKPIVESLDKINGHDLSVLRLDLIHPVVSGNKWFKLRYNLQASIDQKARTIITFGGAHSNHIAATAFSCKENRIACIGIIRGEDTTDTPTLNTAKENGMQLKFISREKYAAKNTGAFLKEISDEYPDAFIIPEGGDNGYGFEGCRTIIKKEWSYDYVLVACGTGTTYAGILASLHPTTKLIGISVLKGANFLPAHVRDIFRTNELAPSLIKSDEVLSDAIINDHAIISRYHFGGYARFHPDLLNFKNSFEERYRFTLDHIYTAKVFYAAFDLIEQKKFKPGSNILLVHTGGLQGNEAFEKRFF